MKRNLQLSVAILSALVLMNPIIAQAKSVSLQDLQKPATTNAVYKTTFTKEDASYKTLQNINKTYSLLTAKQSQALDNGSSISRNEAAIILISLTGKIEKNALQLTEDEKSQLDLLKLELKDEIQDFNDIVRDEVQNQVQNLNDRLASLEASVGSLKGSVSKVEEADKKNLKYDFGQDFKIGGLMQGRYSGNITNGADSSGSSPSFPPNFSIPYSHLSVTGKFHPHVGYKFDLRPERAFTSAARGILGDAYVSTDIIPKHQIVFGQSVIPVGYDGTMSVASYDSIDRTQIGRKFSYTRDIGVKLVGKHSFVDYTFGTYNGTGQNTTDVNNGLNVNSWVVVKPFYKKPELGKLELCGGYKLGRTATIQHQNIANYAVAYQYKKYGIRTEYAKAYNFSANNSDAQGWYIHNFYDLNKKIRLIARYDQYDPNSTVGKDTNTEYTLGSVYSFKGDNLKLLVNFTHVNNDAGKGSNRVGVMTQYKF